MPIAAATPSAVRSSGRIQRGRRAAIQRRTRFSALASRKFGSRVALTAGLGAFIPPFKPTVNKGYARADNRFMSSTYNHGSRSLQDRFDTRRLADRLDERFVQRRT